MVTNPPTQVVVVQQFSDSPVFINCPVCRSPIVTQVRHQSGILTHLMCGLLCLFGCFPGCCLLPYLIPALKDIEHSCPVCGITIARITRL
ncbi:hypothetical protein D915_003981 [Fasciola hepatica]|uniref:LITAF domain-containing protein n=1 Tax=Fasciola hepatica TaxID=6192 RepID=A0A4E0RGE4_FASHE|nr:hypothetical protein D915_003981 [Fasciola hepatica]